MKKVSVLILAVFSLFLFTKSVGAKTLPQAKKTGQKQTVSNKNAASGINVFPRLRMDRRALIVYFSNLQNASSVSYMLTYKTNTQDEGAMGGINLTGASNSSQEILFGTCSKNVCRYHSGIHDAKLEVSYTTKAGKKYLKKYKINI